MLKEGRPEMVVAPSEAGRLLAGGPAASQQELRSPGLHSLGCNCCIACTSHLAANYPSSLTGKLFEIDLFLATRMVDT